MSKSDRKKPVFHEAQGAKSEFRPHRIGAAEEHEGTGAEIDPSNANTEDLDALLDADSLQSDPAAGVEADPEPGTSTGTGSGDTLGLPFGWNVITPAQQDGKSYLVSSNLEAPGTLAFWRKTRVLSHFKWVLNGKWSDCMTRADILPEPRYFKEI